jgi:hypothetical protein
MSIVGQTLGDQIDRDYKQALTVSNLTREQVAHVLVDLNRRIHGDFCVIEEDENKIVLGKSSLPIRRPSHLSSVPVHVHQQYFRCDCRGKSGLRQGRAAREDAKGQPGCRVVVHFNPTPEAEAAEGREYLKAA